jgi:hypothetical protein
MRIIIAFALFALLTLCLNLHADEAPASPWPLDIQHAKGVITLYQPQLEKLEGNVLTGRAAASYLPTDKGEDERIFGALWFTAALDIDRVNDVAKARTMTITKFVTPKGEKTADDGAEAKKVIQDAVIAMNMEIDLDRLIATLEEVSGHGTDDFNIAPPRILIRQEPTILVVLDGEAQMRDIDGLKRVVNSPAFLVEAGGQWWLRGDRDWLTADSLQGPYKFPSHSVPTSVTNAAKKDGFSTSIARLSDASPPTVIIATAATELVVFTGKPSFAPIGDGALLGASNCDTTAIIEVASGKQFLLLAGRWYRAEKLSDDAAWELVKPTDLPEAFTSIPANSDYGDVRAHVAGTPEADEATAQQQIPQTARIPRNSSITVAFDGEPKWVKVSNMQVEYAENSADAVFRLPGEMFYACRDGVWYESKNPKDKFMVATSVPEALRRLPADCPWHNVTYVQVYESTPEYVWCGYTPGYMGWYSYYGCPVYGTGWWYRGWYGPIVYPRPCTWGVGIHYNPWSGWGVSIGVSGPHWSIGISSGGGHGGWYGSGGVNNINIDNSTNINIGNGNNNIGNGNRPNNQPSTRPAIYDRVPGADQPKFQDAGNRLRGETAARPTTKPATRDNLAVDRDGNIARPTTDGGWQTREAGSWKDQPKPAATPAERPVAKPTERPTTTPTRQATPTTRPAPSFQNTQQQRSRGEQRVQQRSMPAARPSGSGGGRRR